MAFFIGFVVGIAFALLMLPFFSKQIMKFAVKRQMNNLTNYVSNMKNQFEQYTKDNLEEVKDGRKQKDNFFERD